MKSRSRVWQYFEKLDDKGGKAACQVCAQVLSFSSGNVSNLARHIRAKHRDISFDSPSREDSNPKEDLDSLMTTTFIDDPDDPTAPPSSVNIIAITDPSSFNISDPSTTHSISHSKKKKRKHVTDDFTDRCKRVQNQTIMDKEAHKYLINKLKNEAILAEVLAENARKAHEAEEERKTDRHIKAQEFLEAKRQLELKYLEAKYKIDLQKYQQECSGAGEKLDKDLYCINIT
ncbi:hypothetical protein M8J75_000958 [Diaphorina citri]|nr:hypothetical protein M8J75_000958 [Diaphorina citri]